MLLTPSPQNHTLLFLPVNPQKPTAHRTRRLCSQRRNEDVTWSADSALEVGWRGPCILLPFHCNSKSVCVHRDGPPASQPDARGLYEGWREAAPSSRKKPAYPQRTNAHASLSLVLPLKSCLTCPPSKKLFVNKVSASAFSGHWTALVLLEPQI